MSLLIINIDFILGAGRFPQMVPSALCLLGTFLLELELLLVTCFW